MTHRSLPSLDELSKHIKYYPDTGTGIWLASIGTVKAGACTGHLNKSGYLQIKFKQKVYLAHRLFWLLHTGSDPGQFTIDHIDGDKSNNKFLNLRLATQAEQMRNRLRQTNNMSGCRGVCWKKAQRKFIAYIYFNKKNIHIGSYATLDQAIIARKAKEIELFGAFSPLHYNQ
jgi:hypothetical protein